MVQPDRCLDIWDGFGLTPRCVRRRSAAWLEHELQPQVLVGGTQLALRALHRTGKKHSMPGLHVIKQSAQSGRCIPPLLFVHGACLGAWCWEDHFLGYFGQLGYLSVALDLRGHGSSAGRDRLQDATIDDFVNDVSEVASQLESPPVVVGHSMGGLITQRFAARNPVSGVVLLASSPIGGMKQHGWALVRAHLFPFLKATITRDMFKIYPDNRRVRHIMFSPNTPEDTVTCCRERLQSESWRACMEMNEPISPPLNISCPMLVLGGELDHTVPEAAVFETGKAYRAPTYIFPGVGHNLMLEPSWQEVAHCIDQWVQACVRPTNEMQHQWEYLMA